MPHPAMPPPRVSVILTVLNEGSDLSELLGALGAQSTPPDEIVIVDGGSTDATLATLRRAAAADPRLVVHVAPGVNIARGRNLAIGLATGDVIAVTDGGCRPDARWLEALLEPLRDPAVGAVAGRLVPRASGRFEHYCGRMSLPDFTSESQHGMFYGRSSAFRREVWERVGGYPEWLYTGEDTLFAQQARALTGMRVAYAPDSLLYWRPRPTLRKMAKMFYLYGRGNGRIANGTLRGSLYWLRHHALLVGTLLAGAIQPWLWLGTAVAAGHLYRTIVRSNLAALEAGGERAPDRFFYVPLIALTRNLATNLGFLHGRLDCRRDAGFQAQLERYQARAVREQ